MKLLCFGNHRHIAPRMKFAVANFTANCKLILQIKYCKLQIFIAGFDQQHERNSVTKVDIEK